MQIKTITCCKINFNEDVVAEGKNNSVNTLLKSNKNY